MRGQSPHSLISNMMLVMTQVASSAGSIRFIFDNSFARELEGFYVPWKAAQVPQPSIVKFNRELAEELRLDVDALDSADSARIFAGNELPEGAAPLAQAYAGHQFGNFVPQLGDGRALLLGEVVDIHGRRRDIQLKGSGRTPFSRSGDGLAALGPVLREYLIGEAMHALGIPTTRALAAVTTGEAVYRETTLPGAVLTRVASSHIRVGTFQYFAARGELDKVQRLADYVIARHYPELQNHVTPYLAMLESVAIRQAALIANWMHVGFIHGVMNTDNMSISGETIDYGPCAFMDHYDPATVFSSIDYRGRYCYANQPKIAQWNLARLAETLLPLIDSDNDARSHALSRSSIDSPNNMNTTGSWVCGRSSDWFAKRQPTSRLPRVFLRRWRGITSTGRWRSATLPMLLLVRTKKSEHSSRTCPRLIRGMTSGNCGSKGSRSPLRIARRQCGKSILRLFRAIIE